MPTPAWVTPTHATASTLATSAAFNTHENDLLYLKDRVDNPPRAMLNHSTTQSIANTTDTSVVFNTEDADTATLHSTVSNTSRITVPTGEGGYWLFTAYVQFAANATGQRTIRLLVDGALLIAQHTVDAAAAGATYLHIAVVRALNAADYCEVVVNQNSGGALNLAATPLFTGIRIA